MNVFLLIKKNRRKCQRQKQRIKQFIDFFENYMKEYRFFKTLFSRQKTLLSLITACLLSLLTHMLSRNYPGFSSWLYHTGSFYASALKSLILLYWLHSLLGLCYHLYTFHWKNNLTLLVQVLSILLLTATFLFIC